MSAASAPMSEASERTLLLLQELSLLKEDSKERGKTAEYQKRRKEIGEELKQIASEGRTERD